MGLFSKFFKKNNAVTDIAANKTFENPECQNLWNLKLFMDGLLNADKYIAKSEYLTALKENHKTWKHSQQHLGMGRIQGNLHYHHLASSMESHHANF